MDTNELRFSLARKDILVILESENNEGETEDKKYYLRDLTGKDRDIYLSFLGGKMIINAEGEPTGLGSFDGLAAKLLQLSLWNEEKTRKVHGLDNKFVDNLPAHVQTALFEASQELSGLTQNAAEAPGND